MKKKVISAILCGAMVLGTVCPVLAADDKKDDTKTEAAAGDSAKDKKIALVGKAAGNAFFEIAPKSLCIRDRLQLMHRSRFLTT